MNIKEIHTTQFRTKFIDTITQYRSKFPGIYRSTQCLAITISDRFEASTINDHQTHILDSLNITIYTFTVLWIACKFHGYTRLKVSTFIQEIKGDEDVESLRKKMIQLEANILKRIDYRIPLYTAYDLLDFQIPACQFMGGNRKKVILKCLKIFMNTIQNSPIMSMKPELGKQFYYIAKGNQGSDMAQKLYNLSKKQILCEQKGKNK